MSENPRPLLPPGKPPWDPWNGARVGALAGGIVALAIVFALSQTSYWLALVGAVIGGALGYWSEKGTQHGDSGS